jgi:hypothetical protein
VIGPVMVAGDPKVELEPSTAGAFGEVWSEATREAVPQAARQHAATRRVRILARCSRWVVGKELLGVCCSVAIAAD